MITELCNRVSHIRGLCFCVVLATDLVLQLFFLKRLVGSVSDLLGVGKLGERRLRRCDWHLTHREISAEFTGHTLTIHFSRTPTIHYIPPSAEVGHSPDIHTPPSAEVAHKFDQMETTTGALLL